MEQLLKIMGSEPTWVPGVVHTQIPFHTPVKILGKSFSSSFSLNVPISVKEKEPPTHNLTAGWVSSPESELACCISLTDTLSNVLKKTSQSV